MTAPDLGEKNKTFPDEIAEALRLRILRGEFQPGDRLPSERELAATLGTNRNTLREALRALEAQGLIRARQGDGIHVLDFREHGELGLLAHYFPVASSKDQAGIMADLLRLRSIIAQEVVVRAAERGTPENLAILPSYLHELAQAHAQSDAAASIRAELTLYRGIVRASQSVTGLWLFNSLERVMYGFLTTSPDIWVTPENHLETWRRVVEAIVARQATKAARALTDMYGAVDHIITQLLSIHATQQEGA